MSDTDGLICAFLLLPDKKWHPINWEEIRRWKPSDGLLWVHIDRSGDLAKAYLVKDSGLDQVIVENLLAEETRPRALVVDESLLVNLRGVNLSKGADPDDMVSLRLWLDNGRIITSRHRHLMAVNDIREDIARGRGPKSTGEFLVEIAGRLVDRMSPVIDDLDEFEDDLEELVVAGEHKVVRIKLAELRRQAIGLRRYLAPQREAMNRLINSQIAWLDAGNKARLRETSDRITRYVEDLDAIRERAAVIQDEAANRVSEEINRNMYILAIVATILLPLSFFTGLLGINVDGMPGSKEAPWSFWVVTSLLGIFLIFEVYIMRRLKWF